MNGYGHSCTNREQPSHTLRRPAPFGLGKKSQEIARDRKFQHDLYEILTEA
jgi:hypothetical protein